MTAGDRHKPIKTPASQIDFAGVLVFSPYVVENGDVSNEDQAMSPLLGFYSLKRRDSQGRTLEEIWQWHDVDLEFHHDFIQWMFPLDEPSAVNADAPLVTLEDQNAFRNDPQLQAAMRKSLSVFLAFLGLTMSADGQIVRGENFNQRGSIWNHPNHNWLRITRVLKSLRLLGFEEEARAFWLFLKQLHDDDGLVSQNSFNYWKEAAEGLNRD